MEPHVRSLGDLGPRICILGPSNSGKSTLADAIARTSERTVIYMDQLRFLPHSDWVERSDAEFFALHEEAIKADSWVADGNFAKCLSRRLEEATGLILLETSVLTSLWRYLRRSWFENNRLGALGGKRDTVKWEMIRFIAFDAPKSRGRYEDMFEASNLPKIKLSSQQEMDVFYKVMDLIRWNEGPMSGR